MNRESHPVSTLDIPALVAELRERRPELTHYAGATHRDLVAWHLCAAYLADRTAPESMLKSRALRAVCAAHGSGPELADALVDDDDHAWRRRYTREATGAVC